MGKRWAWMAGWVYAWALCCTMAGVATGVAPFLAQLFGVDSTPLANDASSYPVGRALPRGSIGMAQTQRCIASVPAGNDSWHLVQRLATPSLVSI